MSELKEQTITSLKWQSIGRFSTVGLSFVFGIILARLLSPSDFGVLGVYAIFFAIAGTFIDSGFSNALIQRKTVTEEDCSTVFWFNTALGIFFYLIFFFTSPLLADFFEIPILEDIIKVTALNILIGALTAVQGTLYRKYLDFRTTAIVNVVSTVVSGFVGITLAYVGFGVWSLVYQGLASSIVYSALLWYYSKWRPRFLFSKKSFNEMFAYGSKLLGASLISQIYFNAHTFVIGKFYTTRDLGLFNKGTGNAKILSTNLTAILSTITFPILSQIQDDDERLIHAYRIYIKVTSLVIFFLMFVYAALARPITLFLYGSKWEGAVIFMQIICFGLMFDHINNINCNIFNVKGRSDIVLKSEIVKRIVSMSMLIVAIPFGVVAICISSAIYAIVAVMINIFFTKKIFAFGYRQQWGDFSIYILLSAIAAIPAFFVTFLQIPYFLQIIVGGFFSLGLYVLALLVRHDEIFRDYILLEIKKRFF